MLMADVAVWTALVIGLMTALPAAWLLFGALWPDAVSRARERIPRRPVSTFLAGAGVSALVLAGVAGLGKAGLAAPAFLLGSFGLGWSFLGVAALAQHAGSRLASPGDPGWKPALRGGAVLALSFLVPFLGWFLLLPVAILLGAGAATFAVFRRRPPAEPAPRPEPAREEVLA
jgi:hypothetical protein